MGKKQETLKIHFSHKRGVYPKGFKLKLTAGKHQTIRYTLDGKEPSEAIGTDYKDSIALQHNTVVKAYAYDKHHHKSETKVHSFFFLNSLPYETGWEYINNITAEEYAESLLSAPIVSASLDADVSTDYQLCSFEYIDNNLDASNKTFHSNAGIKKFGQYSIKQFNSGIKFKFNHDFYSQAASYNFFDAVEGEPYVPINKIERLEFKEGEDGPQSRSFVAGGLGYMRYSEKIVMNLKKRMGKFALCTRFAHLYINGKYHGLKTMRDDFAAQNETFYFGDDSKNYTRINLQDDYFATGNVDEGDGDSRVWKAVQQLAVSKNFQAFKEKVNVTDLIQFMLIFMFTDTENEATALIHNNAPEHMKMIFMMNDTDGAFFNAPVFLGGGGNSKTKWSKETCMNGPGGFFRAFAGNNFKGERGNLEFRTMVKDEVLQQIGPAVAPFEGADNKPLSAKSVQGIMENTVHELDMLYKMDATFMGFNANAYHHWKKFKHPAIMVHTFERVAFNLQKWMEYGLTHSLSKVEISKSVTTDGRSNIEISGIDKGAKVYYTTDGSDPMGNDGVLSVTAILYNAKTGIEVISGHHQITARSFVKDNWGPKATENIFIS